MVGLSPVMMSIIIIIYAKFENKESVIYEF